MGIRRSTDFGGVEAPTAPVRAVLAAEPPPPPGPPAVAVLSDRPLLAAAVCQLVRELGFRDEVPDHGSQSPAGRRIAVVDSTGDPCAAEERAARLAAEGWRVVLIRDAVCSRCLSALRDRGIDPLPADADLEEWRRALRAVAEGERASPRALPDCPRRTPEDRLLERLTARERQVVRLTAQGLTTPEVARILWLSPRTVETHRANAMRKLGVRRVADLVRIAVRGCLAADGAPSPVSGGSVAPT